MRKPYQNDWSVIRKWSAGIPVECQKELELLVWLRYEHDKFYRRLFRLLYDECECAISVYQPCLPCRVRAVFEYIDQKAENGTDKASD